MKTTILITILALVSLAGNAAASTTTVKKVPVNHVFSPTGFDSNDSSEIVISGILPNLCYKSPSSAVTVNGKNIEVEVTSLYHPEVACPEMAVPFTETVHLGVMDKGNYKITVNKKSQFQIASSIKIAESTSNSVDDFNYAYVDYVEKELGSNIVKLKGFNPSDCFVLDKVDYVSNGSDTYSVLPKMKQVSSFCPMKLVPFSYEFEVPKELNAPKVLLHVRTMNGNAVNSIFNNIAK